MAMEMSQQHQGHQRVLLMWEDELTDKKEPTAYQWLYTTCIMCYSGVVDMIAWSQSSLHGGWQNLYGRHHDVGRSAHYFIYFIFKFWTYHNVIHLGIEKSQGFFRCSETIARKHDFKL